MAQTRAAGFRGSDRGGRPSPPLPPLPPLPPAITPFDPNGEISATDNRAAARAALADAFAERFGVDEAGPSAAALADRFGFRYEAADPYRPAARRTVTITGRGTARAVPPAERAIGARGSRSARRASGRRSATLSLRADRIALCAVALGLLLALVAAMSAHAAVAGVHATATPSRVSVTSPSRR